MESREAYSLFDSLRSEVVLGGPLHLPSLLRGGGRAPARGRGRRGCDDAPAPAEGDFFEDCRPRTRRFHLAQAAAQGILQRDEDDQLKKMI